MNDWTFPRFVWITYAGDYDELLFENTTMCNRNELAPFLDKMITLLPATGSEMVS